MYFAASQVIAAISGLLALCYANPFSLNTAPGKLDKRACPTNYNNQYSLAHKLGKPYGGNCDRTYRAGATTCSCNLGAIVSGSQSVPTLIYHSSNLEALEGTYFSQLLVDKRKY